MTAAQPSGIRRTPVEAVPALNYQQFAVRYPAFIADVAQAKLRLGALLTRLARANPGTQRGLVRKLLHERRNYLPHLLRALNRTGRLSSMTPCAIIAMAEQINAFAPCQEQVRTRLITVGTRGRFVQSFGPIKRAQQRLVADVIRATKPLRPNQFLFGGGVPAALAVVEAACADGLTHAVELDVENFYGAIPRERLAETLWPLPKAVVDHVVWDETLRVAATRPPDVITVMRVTPPLNLLVGLPLGSSSSPVVSEVLIGQLLADHGIAFDADIITYADNLLVLGRSEEEAIERAELLTAVAARPDHGSLRLRVRETGHCLPMGMSEGGGFAPGVPFVGQLGLVDEGGVMSWEPSPLKRDQHRVAIAYPLPSLEEIAVVERKVAAFHRAYPRWRDRDAAEAQARAELACARFFHNTGSVDAMSVAARSLVLAWLINRGEQGIDEMIPDGGPSRESARDRLIQETERLWNVMRADDGVTDRAA